MRSRGWPCTGEYTIGPPSHSTRNVAKRPVERQLLLAVDLRHALPLLRRYFPAFGHSSIRFATSAVHPVWCDAPMPAPLSPWKYS
jgi:hypothetical protein